MELSSELNALLGCEMSGCSSTHQIHILAQHTTLYSETSYFRMKALAGTSAKSKCKEPIQLCSAALLVFITPGATLKIILWSLLTLHWPQLQRKSQLLYYTTGLTKKLICKPVYLLPLYQKKSQWGKKALTSLEVSLLLTPCSVNSYIGIIIWS